MATPTAFTGGLHGSDQRRQWRQPDRRSDTLLGGGGNDTLSGKKGADHMNGGAGNDALSGGNGNDVIHGGSGIDRMVGNSGNDLFTFANGDADLVGNAKDVITDFTIGQDKLALPFSTGWRNSSSRSRATTRSLRGRTAPVTARRSF